MVFIRSSASLNFMTKRWLKQRRRLFTWGGKTFFYDHYFHAFGNTLFKHTMKAGVFSSGGVMHHYKRGDEVVVLSKSGPGAEDSVRTGGGIEKSPGLVPWGSVWTVRNVLSPTEVHLDCDDALKDGEEGEKFDWIFVKVGQTAGAKRWKQAYRYLPRLIFCHNADQTNPVCFSEQRWYV